MNLGKFFEFPLILAPIGILLLLIVIAFLIVRKVRNNKKGLPKKEGMFKDLKGFFKKGKK